MQTINSKQMIKIAKTEPTDAAIGTIMLCGPRVIFETEGVREGETDVWKLVVDATLALEPRKEVDVLLGTEDEG